MKVVLASASARRRDILNVLDIDFEVFATDVDESKDRGSSPVAVCETLARRKALAASAQFSSDTLVIGSDTLVHLDGEILEKPKCREDAFRMLRSLSGKTHEVYSGVSLCLNGECVTDHDLSRVTFKELSDEEIEFYIDNYPPFDKAGSYGIQDYAALFVEKTEGDYLSIIGFPLFKAAKLLYENYGIKITDLRQRR